MNIKNIIHGVQHLKYQDKNIFYTKITNIIQTENIINIIRTKNIKNFIINPKLLEVSLYLDQHIYTPSTMEALTTTKTDIGIGLNLL